MPLNLFIYGIKDFCQIYLREWSLFMGGGGGGKWEK